MPEPVLTISYFLHMIATVFWIGGLVIFLLLVWPEARQTLNDPEASRRIEMRLRRRFRPIANLSLVVLLGTGMIQMSANDNYDGLLQFTNTWSIAMLLKHIAYAGMVVIAGLIQFGIAPALERANLLASKGKQPEEWAKLLKRERQFTWLMGGLGILVLFFTAIATAV
jgi:uncharacterized membrane protein